VEGEGEEATKAVVVTRDYHFRLNSIFATATLRFKSGTLVPSSIGITSWNVLALVLGFPITLVIGEWNCATDLIAFWRVNTYSSHLTCDFLNFAKRHPNPDCSQLTTTIQDSIPHSQH